MKIKLSIISCFIGVLSHAQSLTIPETVEYINKQLKSSKYSYNSTEKYVSPQKITYNIRETQYDSIAINQVGEMELYVFSIKNKTSPEAYLLHETDCDTVRFVIIPMNAIITSDSNSDGWNDSSIYNDSKMSFYYYYPPTKSIIVQCQGNQNCIQWHNATIDHYSILLPYSPISSGSIYRAFQYLFKKIKSDPKYKDPFSTKSTKK